MMVTSEKKSTRTWFAIGSLTRPASYFAHANGKGITLLALDLETGQFTVLSETQGIDNPTYLAFSAKQRALYATSEVEGWNEGTVSAYKVDMKSGKLFYIDKQATSGSISAHLCIDRDDKHLFVTNYSHENASETPRKAVSAFPIADDGGLKPSIGTIEHVGVGFLKDRQSVPHPHCCAMSADGKAVWVTDLGLDKIFCYEFDGNKGLLAEAPFEIIGAPPASGPRHLIVRGDNRLYVVNELLSSITVYSRNPASRKWENSQIVSTLERNDSGPNLCAALHISPDGRHLYASNRGDDSIVCFSVNGRNGALEPVGWTPTGGRTPRDFAFTPDGRCVVVANQDSDKVVAFSRNPETGELKKNGAEFGTGTPMCIVTLSS